MSALQRYFHAAVGNTAISFQRICLAGILRHLHTTKFGSDNLSNFIKNCINSLRTRTTSIIFPDRDSLLGE
jgi:hypothetical protein